MLTIKKAVNDVVTVLQKKESPINKGEKIWDSLLNQSEEEGTWDDKLIKAVEKETCNYLSSVNEDDLRQLWNKSGKGLASFEDFETINIKKIKTDLADEFMDRIMDKVGGGSGDYSNNYSDNYYNAEDEDGFSEKENEDDEDFGYKDGGDDFLEGDDLFDEDDMYDDEKY